MNRFAEIKYGRVNDIVETLNDLTWVRTIFSPISLWTDITDMLDSEGIKSKLVTCLKVVPLEHLPLEQFLLH